MLIITYILIIILNLAICSSVSKTEHIGNEIRKKVVIVGAGPAGISAASRLIENNITNVIILEAENRVGGRIHSVPFGETTVDLGAEWCTAEKGNIVYDLVSNLDLIEYHDYNGIAYYHSSRKPLDTIFLQEIHTEAFSIYNASEEGVDVTLGDYIIQKFNGWIIKKYGGDSVKTELAQDFLHFFEKEVLSNEGALSWFDVASHTGYDPDEEEKYCQWKGKGYKMILDVLTKKYPDPSKELPVYSSVILQKDVKTITVGDVVELECSDNTTYKAEHVVWTPSLGVLKHRHKQIFKPALSQQKVGAIESLGIGAVQKILFYFPQKWWPDNIDRFAFIWNESDIQNARQEFSGGLEVVSGLNFLTQILP